MEFLEIFRKQGGMKLVKQYIKSGSFLPAVGVFLSLGKSHTALEILRLSARLKIKQNLYKAYQQTLNAFDRNYDTGLPHETSNKVWICWLQGMDQAPELVQGCFKSVKNNLREKEIILITSENMNKYVQFPDFIIDKWKQGIITHTHLTDLLRTELLIRYGGLWLDATVFCTSPENEIPTYFFDSDLFFYQMLKPGRDGNAYYLSSWLISAKTNNKILMAVRDLCYDYWRENNSMVDYFLFHALFSIVLDYYPAEWNSVIPRDNCAPHILLLRLLDQYDDNLYKAICAQTPFHKLSYKLEESEKSREGTYYKVLFGGKECK